MPEFLGLEILRNAERLLDDAKLLRSNRRYASVASFAVLSLEEAAKFAVRNRLSILRQNGPGAGTGHKPKQRVAGNILVGGMLIDEIEEIAAFRNFTISIVAKDENDKGVSFGSQIADIISTITDDEYEKLKGKLIYPEDRKAIFDTIAGKLNRVKQNGFYVDLDKDGNVLGGPHMINRKVADKLLSLAKRCIRSIKREMRRMERREAYLAQQ